MGHLPLTAASCFPIRSDPVNHARRSQYKWLPNLVASGGGGLMFDLGDASVLGALTNRGRAISVFEQMLLWHAEQWLVELRGASSNMGARRPIHWSVFAKSTEHLSQRGRIGIELSDGKGRIGKRLCRRIDVSAPWLDGQPLSSSSWHIPCPTTARAVDSGLWFLVAMAPGEHRVYSLLPLAIGGWNGIINVFCMYCFAAVLP